MRGFTVSLALGLLFVHTPSFAQDFGALERELGYLRAETFVVTASRTKESVSKSAASITVITAREIREMGANTISDVLNTVPGINMTMSNNGLELVDVRGITTNSNEKIAFMKNGVPTMFVFSGGGISFYEPIDTIERIEVIRGPGSALYGANAVSAVINVITKDPGSVDGATAKASVGSFGAQRYSLMYGGEIGELKTLFSVYHIDSDGFKETVNHDSVSNLDLLQAPLGVTPSSMAPGPTNLENRYTDVVLNLKYGKLSFNAQYQDYDQRDYIGFDYSLSDEGTQSHKIYLLDLGFETELSDGITLHPRIYLNGGWAEETADIFPDGATITAESGPALYLPEGLLYEGGFTNVRTGADIQIDWKATESNIVIAGLVAERQEQSDVTLNINFDFDAYQSAPLHEVEPWNKNATRDFWAVYLEDIWDITNDLRVTLGIRNDSYSDFGSSVTPRAGLTWEFFEGLDFKLIYGEAFRAPTFYELYTNDPFKYVANPDLEPEKARTVEASIGMVFTEDFSARFTLFQSNYSNLISIAPLEEFSEKTTFKNIGSTKSEGFELEALAYISGLSYIRFNYTHQKPVLESTGDPLPFVPTDMANAIVNIRLSKYLNFNAQAVMRGSANRETTDIRGDMAGYGLLNSTLTLQNLPGRLKPLEIRLSGYNLTDTKYSYPSPVLEYGVASLPGVYEDYPAAGVSFTLEAEYTF